MSINFEELNNRLEESKRLVSDNDYLFITKYIYSTTWKGKIFDLFEFYAYVCFELYLMKPSTFDIYFDRCIELNIIKVENRKVYLLININNIYEELLNIENPIKKNIKKYINKLLIDTDFEYEKVDKNGIVICYKPKTYNIRINLSESYKNKYGLISCDCMGWKYHRNCRHCSSLNEIIKDSINDIKNIWKEYLN